MVPDKNVNGPVEEGFSQDSNPFSTGKKKWLGGLRWVIAALIVSAIGHRIWIEKGKVAGYALALHPGWIPLSMGCYGVAMIGCAYFWWLALKDFGGSPSFLNTAYAYLIGHLGKYVPGKGLVIVLRAALLQADGTTTSDAAVTAILETLFLMAVGALICPPVFLFSSISHRLILSLVCLLLGCLFGILVFPSMTSKARTWLARILPALASKKSCRWKTMGEGFLIMVSTWALCGLSLLFVIRSMSDRFSFNGALGFFHLWAVATASISFATVVGFLSMRPGGVGAREWVLIEMLGPVIGMPRVMLAAGVLRLGWIGTELLIGALFWYFNRRWTPMKKSQ
ncbi:MAG: lysylphosphatidylglycerol synthase domain-containing protein [Terriglobia bacterium]